MKRFTFYIVILLVFIIFLFFGLVKNKISLDTSENEDFIISQAKDQKFSLAQKENNIFILKGQVADGTHSQVIVYVTDKADNSIISQETINVGTEPFEYELTLPENKTSVYINIYYNEGKGIAICTNAVNAVNNEGKWQIAEIENLKANQMILGHGNKNHFTYSNSELDTIPQGLLVLSDTITKAHTNDYDKAYALYVWLAEHIYIAEKLEDKSLEYSYNTRICDNETYANLYAAMLRIQGIPCTITECENGYLFNEVYVNDRWINVQIDRDTFNRYTSHQYIYNRKNLYTHFDVPDEIISVNYIVKSQRK